MMFGALADRYGWTFEQIGELTIDQAEGAMSYIAKHPPVRLF